MPASSVAGRRLLWLAFHEEHLSGWCGDWSHDLLAADGFRGGLGGGGKLLVTQILGLVVWGGRRMYGFTVSQGRISLGWSTLLRLRGFATLGFTPATPLRLNWSISLPKPLGS